MKRIALLFIIAMTMLLATACGGSSAPAATQGPAMTDVAVQQPVATDQPTQQSTVMETPTLPTTATDTPAATGGGTKVNITLADNTIESSLTTFKVGEPYTFVIANTGRHAHNFNISTPASIAGSTQDAQATALLSVSEDQLGSGSIVTVDYTFPDTAAGAQLEFSCLIKRHYEDGMKLAITATK